MAWNERLQPHTLRTAVPKITKKIRSFSYSLQRFEGMMVGEEEIKNMEQKMERSMSEYLPIPNTLAISTGRIAIEGDVVLVQEEYNETKGWRLCDISQNNEIMEKLNGLIEREKGGIK